jgi:acyl-CoA reductase-like NAD-dependent aldehyde dehydrogenase
MIWLAPVEQGAQWSWIKNNRFPLSDTILSRDVRLIRAMTIHSRAARICVNHDPSVESMFEPWGGYPPSGSNPVSRWIEKYSQAFQLDGDVHQIMAVPPLTTR